MNEACGQRRHVGGDRLELGDHLVEQRHIAGRAALAGEVPTVDGERLVRAGREDRGAPCVRPGLLRLHDGFALTQVHVDALADRGGDGVSALRTLGLGEERAPRGDQLVEHGQVAGGSRLAGEPVLVARLELVGSALKRLEGRVAHAASIEEKCAARRRAAIARIDSGGRQRNHIPDGASRHLPRRTPGRPRSIPSERAPSTPGRHPFIAAPTSATQPARCPGSPARPRCRPCESTLCS